MSDLSIERKRKSIYSCLQDSTLKTLTEMRVKNMLTDATIVLDKDSVVTAHKIVLCAASDYFRCHFVSNPTKNEIKLSDISVGIMNTIINYIYSHSFIADKDTILDVLSVADKLKIPSLIKLCSNYILSELLNTDNCLFLMIYARANVQFDDQQLLNAIRLHALQHFELIAESNYLVNISMDELYDLINDDLLNVRDEKLVWQCCMHWINHAPHDRINCASKLLKAIRLGLLDKNYFIQNIKPFQTVCDSKSIQSLIRETEDFWKRLNMWTTLGFEIDTPKIATPRIPNEISIVIGGQLLKLGNTFMESYDIRSDRWTDVTCVSMGMPSEALCYHGCVANGSKIYCIGGFDGQNYLNSCQMFDVVMKTWLEIAPMHIQRCHVAVAELNGKIYAIGGFDGVHRMQSAEVYDPETNQWAIIASMNSIRSDGCACALNGRVYVFGGYNGFTCLSTAECYDSITNQWHSIEAMMSRRCGLGCVAFNGYIFVVGGFDGYVRLNSMERYDVERDTWKYENDMINARSNFGIAVLDKCLMVAGGFDGLSILTQTECFNFDDGIWIEANNLNYPRLALAMCTVIGVSNIREYAYPHRERLLMEKMLDQ